MNINYPIKYAVLELKERGGWSVGYEYITQGFIASKCYVIESSIVYRADGSNKIIHKVVFPFSDIETFRTSFSSGKQNIGKPELPRYNACDEIYPITIVTSLFDSYESAKALANEKNEDYKQNIIFTTPTPVGSYLMGNNNLHNVLTANFEKTLEICNIFEQLVLEETEDMDISEELFMNEQKSFVKILKPIKKSI